MQLACLKMSFEVSDPSLLHVCYSVPCFLLLGHFAQFGLEKLSVYAGWTGPLLFSLGVNANGHRYREKLALLLPLMHLV